MPFGEDFTYKEGGVDKQRTTVYVPGLRGTDGVRVTLDGAETAVGWPLYDTHGNNVGMVRQAAGTGFTLGDEQRYDAWGAAVWQTGDPPMQGYSANLGHRADGESSLVYMRARYYEPWNGRFISEDPARDGLNWYVYCGNSPTDRVDVSGEDWQWIHSFYQAMKPLLQQVGVDALVQLALKKSAVAAGYALEWISMVLINGSMAVASLGEKMATRGGVSGRLFGAFLGRAGALGVRAALQIRQLSYWLLAFGGEMGPNDFKGLWDDPDYHRLN